MVASLTIRPLAPDDVPKIVSYWSNADDDALTAMGVDLRKMPTSERLEIGLHKQLLLPISQRQAYCVLWEVDGEPVGHSNTNPTHFGVDARMHLHLWRAPHRGRGLGVQFLRLTVPHYFAALKLKELFAEPYALNPAPHRALERAGFGFVKQYVTVPGSINFEQSVKQWRVQAADLQRFRG